MTEFSYTVTEDEGLHARPAGLLVKKAQQHNCELHMVKGGRKADLKRIFAIMSLCVKQGDTIMVQCNGEGEEQAAAELQSLMQENL